MRFLLFCEGHTEKMALAAFLKHGLDLQLSKRVGISPVRFDGWRHLYKDVKKKAHLRLQEDDIIAVISLLDLYGPDFYPPHCRTADERYCWGKHHIEEMVDHGRFRQFFAVHETEAWLLSDPTIFPTVIRKGFPGRADRPESVNFNEPPAKLLERLYTEKMKSTYKKVTNGKEFFGQLTFNTAYAKCPRFAEMMDEMLRLAEEAGL